MADISYHISESDRSKGDLVVGRRLPVKIGEKYVVFGLRFMKGDTYTIDHVRSGARVTEIDALSKAEAVNTARYVIESVSPDLFWERINEAPVQNPEFK